MKIKVKLYDVEATLDQDGNWLCEDNGVETILETLKDSMPGTPSVKHPLVELAEWEMEVLGGKIISTEEEPVLREGAIY